MPAKSGPKGFKQQTGRPSVPSNIPEGFRKGKLGNHPPKAKAVKPTGKRSA